MASLGDYTNFYSQYVTSDFYSQYVTSFTPVQPPAPQPGIKSIMVDIEFTDGSRWGIAGKDLRGNFELNNVPVLPDLLENTVVAAKSTQGLLVVKLRPVHGSQLGIERIAEAEAA